MMNDPSCGWVQVTDRQSFVRQANKAVIQPSKPMKITETLYVTHRGEWREWLALYHQTATEVWLIYYKRHTKQPTISYDHAVEEALCFGWIDSTVKRIDDERYAQKFTPRKDRNNWSEPNRRRARRLVKEGLMTPAGLEKIPASVLSGKDVPAKKRKKPELVVPDFVEAGFRKHPPAWENFQALAPSYRREFVGWITQAKREETRQRRMAHAIELLKENRRL